MKPIHIVALAGCGLLALATLASCDQPDTESNTWRNWKGTPSQQADGGAGTQTPPPAGTGQPATETPDAVVAPVETPQQDSGSQQKPPADSGTQPPPATQHTTITFDLPDGWVHEPALANRAVLRKPSADGLTPYYMVEVYRAWAGDNEKARQVAKAAYQELVDTCEKLCVNAPVYLEKQVAGKDLFIAAGTNHALGHEIWNSSIYFEKNGFVYEIGINDLLENQEQTVAKIIASVQGG